MVPRTFMTKSTRMAVIALGMITLACGGARGGQVTGIVSFGDSLSDLGNFYAATGGASPPSSLNYDQGGFPTGRTGSSIWPRISESPPQPPASMGEPIMPTAAR